MKQHTTIVQLAPTQFVSNPNFQPKTERATISQNIAQRGSFATNRICREKRRSNQSSQGQATNCPKIRKYQKKWHFECTTFAAKHDTVRLRTGPFGSARDTRETQEQKYIKIGILFYSKNLKTIREQNFDPLMTTVEPISFFYRSSESARKGALFCRSGSWLEVRILVEKFKSR